MNQITENAYAKINLALDVLRKRPDGYHDVRMVMQTVRLHDKLSLRKTGNEGITLRTNLAYLPINENNLVYKAVQAFREVYRITEGVSVSLEKRIPVAAGLAGGSSDAAAALRAMNELFDIRAGLTELQSIGVRIGADVPYCLLGGTALSEGIGEQLTSLPAVPSCPCLIVKPDFALSTRYVYEHLNLSSATKHPDLDAMLMAIRTQNITQITANVGNLLENVSIDLHPQIAEIKQELLSFGALCSLMSGSGPSVFALFRHKAEAEHAYYHFKLGPYGRQTFLTYLK